MTAFDAPGSLIGQGHPKITAVLVVPAPFPPQKPQEQQFQAGKASAPVPLFTAPAAESSQPQQIFCN